MVGGAHLKSPDLKEYAVGILFPDLNFSLGTYKDAYGNDSK